MSTKTPNSRGRIKTCIRIRQDVLLAIDMRRNDLFTSTNIRKWRSDIINDALELYLEEYLDKIRRDNH